MQDKSTQQLRDDLAEMLRLSAKTTSAERRRIYDTTAGRIQRELDRRMVDNANPAVIHAQPTKPLSYRDMDIPNPPSRTITPPSPCGEGPGVGPMHAEGIEMDEYIYRAKSEPDTAAPHIHIVAPLGGGPKKVRIQWGDDSTITLTEGICRSRFTSALRDLCESTYAEQERYDDLRYYTSFHRACGYYRGLSALWGRQPTAREIGLGTLSRVRSTVLDMIIAAAAAASQPTAS